MESGRWKRIEAIFHEACERPVAGRLSFVREACGDDDALYSDVKSLLEADGTPHSLLDGRAIEALEAPRPTLTEGTRVGPYRVIRSLGVGGMGVVYLAERADGQFEQRVALKLVKRGMDSDSILARFRAERRILARLQHPNIASLLDGGVTEDGLPFFTMEYVDGQPITDYCDERRNSIEERLDLFQSVCAAVQYAHANLVVHRDLKPSNILVTNDGHVKLLDFGIARVLDEDEGGLTRSGQRVMTPAYASPEQVRGEPVTTASDVYALGVVLYELLCGRHPHRDTTSTPAELERAIADTPAERPSRFLDRIEPVASVPTPASLESIAAARDLSPARLRRRLEGDLDNICLVALRKEPGRRYSSASQLLDDIRLHLAGRPVSARPDTVRYRFGKFVRRNRAGVGVAAALVVLVTTLTIVYTTRLARERDRARLEAQKAAEVSAFLAGLFEAADPNTSRGETITAREMLDAGRDRVHAELADQPDVLADMLRTIGTAYANLGIYEDAERALRESVALRSQVAGERDSKRLSTTARLLGVLNETGRYEEADSLARHAIEIGRTLEDRGPLADLLGALATSVNYRGDYDAAEPLYRAAIDEWVRSEGASSPTASTVMNNLALLLHEESRYAEADTLFRRALAIQERAFGRRHPETSTTRYNYAQLLADEGHLSEARATWDEVLATDRALYPEGHPAIAYTLSAYGRLLSRMGQYAEAERLQREALEIRRAYHGTSHSDIAYSLGALGRVLHDEAFYDEAQRHYREALDMHREVSGPNHPILGALMNDLGHLLADRGNYAAADSLLRRSLEFQRSVAGGSERNAMAVSMVRRAAVLVAMGRLPEAETLAREGLSMSHRLHRGRGIWVAGAGAQLAAVRLRMGAVAEAESLFTDTLARMRTMEEEGSARPRDTASLLGLGRCRLASGDIGGAESRFREALAIEREYLRDGHPRTARAETALATALMAKGEIRAAEPLLRHAVHSLSALVEPTQVDLVEARRALASCLGMSATRQDATSDKLRP